MQEDKKIRRSPRLVDRTGQDLGQFRILEYKENNKWSCECKLCGFIRVVHSSNITANKVKNCPNCQPEKFFKKTEDRVIGKRYGKLVVLAKLEEYVCDKVYYWLVKCDCGTTKKMTKPWKAKACTSSCGRKGNVGDPVSTAINSIIGDYKRSAIKRNYEWSLTEDDVFYLIFDKCYYCHKELSNSYFVDGRNYRLKYNGIDRKINSLGYTKENCVSCCYQCNKSKLDVDHNNFLDMIKRISEVHLGKQI